MCSLNGSVGYSEMFCIEANRHQAKRGPDGSHVHRINQNTFFGHTLLSIIGHQTQPIESIRYVMVFNGCWYTFKDFYPYETSDTSALLKHIENKGFREALNDITGMYAIAIFDKLQNKIFAACDRFAEKNLYYYHEHEKFIFASTPAALLQVKDKWTINKDALQSYWLLGSTMGEDSIWSGIKKLCASEMLEYEIAEDKITISRYWEPKYIENAESIIEEVVINAIQSVKVSDVPINIFLSGGIDSTLVASQFQGYEAIHLDSPEYNYAKQVADKFNIRLRCLSPKTIEIHDALHDYCYQSGEPTMSGLIPYITAKEVSQYGKVAIIANGADELFFGYNRTHEGITQEQISHTYRYIPPTKNYTYPFFCRFNEKSSGRLFELNGFVQFDLNKTLDFASGCHSLEVRSPFLNHNLVETALSIPESVHRKNGNKTILKRMLKRMGFDDQFLNRPKLGFSIHYQPDGMPELKRKCLNWCIVNGYLNLNGKAFNTFSGRDQQYLEMSALGFYHFFNTWKHKIQDL